jgi:hypothetical protein
MGNNSIMAQKVYIVILQRQSYTNPCNDIAVEIFDTLQDAQDYKTKQEQRHTLISCNIYESYQIQ